MTINANKNKKLLLMKHNKLLQPKKIKKFTKKKFNLNKMFRSLSSKKNYKSK